MNKIFFDNLQVAYDELYTTLNREVANSHEAADLTQSSMERMLRLPRNETVHSPGGLLWRIARNLRIDTLRQKKRIQLESLDSRADADSLPAMVCELSPERILLGQERVSLLCEAIDSMPPRCREAFVLNRIHGLSHDEVASEMGISLSMVEKHVALGIKICREILER